MNALLEQPIGTRYSDFTTASKTAFRHPDVRFVNRNVTVLVPAKHSGVMLLADARVGLEALARELAGYRVPEECPSEHRRHFDEWNRVVDDAHHLGHQPLPAQTEVLRALNETIGGRAARKRPGGRQRRHQRRLRWRHAHDPDVEAGYRRVRHRRRAA